MFLYNSVFVLLWNVCALLCRIISACVCRLPVMGWQEELKHTRVCVSHMFCANVNTSCIWWSPVCKKNKCFSVKHQCVAWFLLKGERMAATAHVYRFRCDHFPKWDKEKDCSIENGPDLLVNRVNSIRWQFVELLFVFCACAWLLVWSFSSEGGKRERLRYRIWSCPHGEMAWAV